MTCLNISLIINRNNIQTDLLCIQFWQLSDSIKWRVWLKMPEKTEHSKTRGTTMSLYILIKSYWKRSSLYYPKSVSIVRFKMSIVTKGKATHLLKRSAKLGADRKPSKEYKVMFTDFKRKIEESKEENEMN